MNLSIHAGAFLLFLLISTSGREVDLVGVVVGVIRKEMVKEKEEEEENVE